MENWPIMLLLAGVLLLVVASFGFSVQPAPAGQPMSDIESFQVFLGILGFAAVLGGIYKK